MELDNREILVVVQEKDDAYAVGDRVRVSKDASFRQRNLISDILKRLGVSMTFVPIQVQDSKNLGQHLRR